MSGLDVGLVVALALLAVVVAAQARALSAAGRRLELLERRLGRRERRDQAPVATSAPSAPVAAATSPVEVAPATTPASADVGAEGDAVDVRGADPEGQPTVIPLEATELPTLLAFLSTSCGICVGLWERLRAGELEQEAAGILPVVVTKDGALEDVDRVRQLATTELPVVLSSEAWDDYEVPGSPYVMVVSSAPGSVVTEGNVASWEDLVRMARSVTDAVPDAR